jgi:tRNA modification GTPase
MTIYALSSPPGKGGVAVLRVSGPQALESYRALTRRKKALEPRRAVYCRMTHPASGEMIDRGLAIYFQAPASFTGEDVVEYHIHGGTAGVAAMLAALGACEGLRPAEAGEFTKRAVLNGKLDLTEAEAVGDLINAETEIQHRLAAAQYEGSLKQLYDGWTARLVQMLAYQEAEIEFPDEDMPDGIAEDLRPQIKELLADLRTHLDDARKGERLREGLKIVILGPPNAGKSSLLNALAARDVAIVSETAGTTRDAIEAHLNLGGYAVTVTDTAGLRGRTEDKIEQEGMARARQRAAEADLKVFLFDAAEGFDKEFFKEIDTETLLVANKSDAAENTAIPDGAIPLSVKTGDGMAFFLKRLTGELAGRWALPKNHAPLLTRQRHRDTLEECRAALEQSLAAELPELAAEDLRLALRALGRLTGRVDVEALLDVIFRDFCIGK